MDFSCRVFLDVNGSGMNSKIVEGEYVPGTKYPVLKRMIVGGTPQVDYVVMFTSPGKGVVVHVFKGGEKDQFGEEVKIGWDGGTTGFGEHGAKLFDGIIQLSN